jgi:hypothetical protein
VVVEAEKMVDLVLLEEEVVEGLQTKQTAQSTMDFTQ